MNVQHVGDQTTLRKTEHPNRVGVIEMRTIINYIMIGDYR